MKNKIAIVLDYYVVGILLGCCLSFALMILASLGECGQWCSSCSFLKEHHKLHFQGLWTWDTFFSLVSLLVVLCAIICTVYGWLSKKPKEIKINVRVFSVVILFIVYISVYGIMLLMVLLFDY